MSSPIQVKIAELKSPWEESSARFKETQMAIDSEKDLKLGGFRGSHDAIVITSKDTISLEIGACIAAPSVTMVAVNSIFFRYFSTLYAPERLLIVTEKLYVHRDFKIEGASEHASLFCNELHGVVSSPTFQTVQSWIWNTSSCKIVDHTGDNLPAE